MYGIELRFGLRFDEQKGWLEKEQEENIEKLLDLLNSNPLDYEYSYWRKWERDTEPWGHVPHFSIKCKRGEESDRVYGLFPRWKKNHNVTCREFEVCTVDNCYRPTAANGKGCLLFRNEIETTWLHEIHEYCTLHVASRQSRQIARTIEATVEVPGYWWTKIVSFQIDKEFWGQRVEKVNEGGYEEGDIPALYPTPWVGPFPTRELAIQAARDYED
jgi:hypothetical protein